jgi:hypothetical protein
MPDLLPQLAGRCVAQAHSASRLLTGLLDFCLWAPPKPNSAIADTEGEEVAWYTKPGRGTRLMPTGTLQGVQFIKTPDYVQVVGFIDQTFINIISGESGGELGALAALSDAAD